MTTPEHGSSCENEIGQTVDLAKKLFGHGMDLDDQILGMTDDDVIAANMHEMLLDPNVTFASLEEDGRIIGFSVAIPIGYMHRARSEESNETAYIYFTGIDSDRQGLGLVAKLMDDMVAQLKARGYGFVERDCVFTQNYADNVEKVFAGAGAIVQKYDHTRWPEVGPERFFRIDLSRL